MTVRNNVLFGFLNVDKPVGMTSHDVVAQVRRASSLKKLGHAGTLDPLASGVLILCVGGATRLSEYVMHGTKRYAARVRLGLTTTTYDAEGEIVRECDAGHITREQVDRVLSGFVGNVEQVPPIYSAIKKDGRKLYDLARAGQTIELEARLVRIDSLTITDWQPPEFTLEVVCGAGTYIRSLAYDLGEALGVGAHLAGLIRTASGGFALEKSVKLAALLAGSLNDWLISPSEALADYPALTLDQAAETDIRHGRRIPGDFADGTTVMAYNGAGRLAAVLQAADGYLHPHKVFNEPGE